MAESMSATHLKLEIVTPEGLLLDDDVDDVMAPGEQGYFGVRPGHTPFLCTLGAGELSYLKNGVRRTLTCFWGFCEVLPDRVNILAEMGERAEDIDLDRAEKARERAEARLTAIRDEEGYDEAKQAYARAVTRLATARRQRD
jgi:F-type H+-transporting ATPase subunit epsilon